MGPIIVIDLGTTNSVAAYMKDGRPVIIPNLEGEALTPSVVAFARDDRRWSGGCADQACANRCAGVLRQAADGPVITNMQMI